MSFSNAIQVKRAFLDMVDRLDENQQHIVREVVAEIMVEVTVDTPRDTNRAATGWNPRNGPSGDFSEPGPGFYSEPNPVAEVAARIPVGSHSATIANGVPYIGSLESGTSRQAPRNFVRKAIEKALRDIESADLIAKK
jgi:hypothetical protein